MTARETRQEKRIAICAVIVVLFAIAFAMYGCGGTPTPARTLFITVDGATDVVNGIAAAAQVSPAFKAQLPTLTPYLDAVYAAQKDADAAIAGNSVGLSTAMQALTDATNALINAKAAALKAALPPITISPVPNPIHAEP